MKLAQLLFEKFYELFAPASLKDEMLWNLLDRTLSNYPYLYEARPSHWPRQGQFKITTRQMEGFQKQREASGDYEGMNLPLALYAIVARDSIENSQAFESALQAFDWFAKELISKPGGKKVLQTLWTSAWDPLRFWAVVAEVFVARHLIQKGFFIEGFEREISGSKRGLILKLAVRGGLFGLMLKPMLSNAT